MNPLAYDFEAKGSADYNAGRKDDRLYLSTADNGAAYRRGWQGARRRSVDAVAPEDPGRGQDRPPEPDPVKRKESPDDLPPDFVPSTATVRAVAFRDLKPGDPVYVGPKGEACAKPVKEVLPDAPPARRRRPALPEPDPAGQLGLF